jgi:hypothetical protein
MSRSIVAVSDDSLAVGEQSAIRFRRHDVIVDFRPDLDLVIWFAECLSGAAFLRRRNDFRYIRPRTADSRPRACVFRFARP